MQTRTQNYRLVLATFEDAEWRRNLNLPVSRFIVNPRPSRGQNWVKTADKVHREPGKGSFAVEELAGSLV